MAAGTKKTTGAKAPARTAGKGKAKPAGAKKAPAAQAKKNGGEPRAPRGGRALIVDVLREADRPLHVKTIAERVLKIDGARRKADRAYKGATPEQTISAALTVSHNTGGPFEKTEPGCFALREWTKAKKDKKPIKPERKQREQGGIDPTVAAHTTVISEGNAPAEKSAETDSAPAEPEAPAAPEPTAEEKPPASVPSKRKR